MQSVRTPGSRKASKWLLLDIKRDLVYAQAVRLQVDVAITLSAESAFFYPIKSK